MLLAEDISHGGTSRHVLADGGNGGNGGELVMPSISISSDSIPVHPMGVKPLGNQFFATGPTARQSLGLLGQLPDEMILQLLEYLDTRSLKDIGFACRFLYAFCQLDDLWKALFLE